MMAKLLNYLLLFPILLLSLLPLKVLYLLSDVTAWFLHKVLRYRYDVALINISRSFPEMKYIEITSLLGKFYKGFTDIFYESVWSLRISRERGYKRLEMKNTEVLKKFRDRGTSVIVMIGHKANWELSNAFHFSETGFAEKDVAVVYKKMSSSVSENLLKWIRMRNSQIILIESKEVVRFMFNNSGRQLLYFFIADQNPPPGSKCITNFLNQPTQMITGPEQLARKFNMPVLYFNIERRSRGNYTAIFEEIEESPLSSTEGKISTKFAELLERSIRENPSEWLWTHKRWKKKLTANQV